MLLQVRHEALELFCVVVRRAVVGYVEASVFAISVSCSMVVPLTSRWLVEVVADFLLMRRILLHIFFIGV